MWSFKKDKKRDIFFEFTEEEQREIENTFRNFKDYAVNPKYEEEIKNALIASALSLYALTTEKLGVESKEINLQKAISSVTKAYNIYQLPLYLYDFACFLEQDGRLEEAIKMYKKFLESQSNYNFGPIDNVLLSQRDLERAIKVAQSKVL